MTSILATLPSPTTTVWYLGPIPLRAYALAILVGIVAAIALTEKRLRERGAPKWFTLDVSVWAVPFGIIGGRLYHLITSPQYYFGKGGHPWEAFAIWNGGLGIWGAVALGAVGALIACRRAGLPLTVFADALAPGLPLAQALGRVGNYFNNELYGRHTDLPWGLTIYQMDLGTGKAVTDAFGHPIVVAGGPFQPTFLYELIWDVLVAVMVYLVDRRYRLGKGRAFALYVLGYTVGRFWVELLRSDDANHILGLRVNTWVSALVFLGALWYFLRVKGPQEHIKVIEGGGLRLVTAEGQQIEWRRWTKLDAAPPAARVAPARPAREPALAAAGPTPAPGVAVKPAAKPAVKPTPTPKAAPPTLPRAKATGAKATGAKATGAKATGAPATPVKKAVKRTPPPKRG